MKKPRIIVFTLIVTVICTMFVGCAPKTESTTTTSSSNSSKNDETSTKMKELEMLWFADGAETEAMQKLINQYQKDNQNIKIELLEVPYSEMTNKILICVTGGEVPALARTTESILGVVHEATLDIGGYVDDREAFIAQFMPAIHNYFIINGKICAAPMDVTANGMIYNKTAFEKAGVEVPTFPDEIWTWDEFTEAVKQVMEKGDVKYGLVIDNPGHRWFTILYEFGGRFLSPEGSAFNSPETIEAIKFTKKLFDEGIIPKSTWLGGEDPNNLFRSGQVAVHLSGNWMLTNYRDNIKDFEWGVTYLPKGKNRSSVPGGKQIAAFANSGVEEESVDFIKYVTSQEPNAQFCSESLFISPRLDNANIEYDFGTEFFEIFANELANTVPDASYDLGYPDFSSKVSPAHKEGLLEVIAGKKTPEEHAAEIGKLVEEIIVDK